MLGKIKADLKKHWLSWIGFIGLVAICIPLFRYCQLERGVLMPWDSYAQEIYILMTVLIGWSIMYITMYFLIRYKVVQAWRQELKKNRSKSKDDDSND